MSDLPLIVINPSECQIAYHHQKSPITFFPEYLEPDGSGTFRDISGKTRRLWKMNRLDRDTIPYEVRSIPDADYVITNRYTQKRTVIKRFTIQELVNLWNRNGKYELEIIFDAIGESYTDIDVIELVIENYFSCRFQYGTDNAIFAPWREQISHNKIDPNGHPIFATTFWVRQEFDPRLMTELIQRIEQKGVKVMKFFDAVDVYSHFKELLFRRDDARITGDLIINRFVHSPEDRLNNMFPEIDIPTWRALFRKYGNASTIIEVASKAINAEEFCGVGESIRISNEMFQKFKTFLNTTFRS